MFIGRVAFIIVHIICSDICICSLNVYPLSLFIFRSDICICSLNVYPLSLLILFALISAFVHWTCTLYHCSYFALISAYVHWTCSLYHCSYYLLWYLHMFIERVPFIIVHIICFDICICSLNVYPLSLFIFRSDICICSLNMYPLSLFILFALISAFGHWTCSLYHCSYYLLWYLHMFIGRVAFIIVHSIRSDICICSLDV